MPGSFVPATIEDNPTLFENDPEYLARLESLPEIEKQRQRYGIWDAFEGQVFKELSKNIHAYEDFDIPSEWERYCVFDWGYSSPFSVGWYAVDYDGVLWRYREWYGCKREELGEEAGADEPSRGGLLFRGTQTDSGRSVPDAPENNDLASAAGDQ